MQYYNDVSQLKMQCEQYMNQPVSVQYQGQQINGVLEHVDHEQIYLMVLVDENGQYMDLAQAMQHQQMNDGYPHQQSGQMHPNYHQTRNPFFPGPGFYPGYFPGYYNPRPNWNRLVLPLAALTAIALL
ncbi:hypothetical protein BTS2_2628 [Bacillus sp. TS-2]|nr:hypothetical protein BTS2_2628 [Bacillus sp. TS-2]